jgi:hypothetical protein
MYLFRYISVLILYNCNIPGYNKRDYKETGVAVSGIVTGWHKRIKRKL